MKDFVLLITTIGMFGLGFYIVKKMDQFLTENTIGTCERQPGSNKKLLQIAAETPVLLDSIAYVMEECTRNDPVMEFGITSARAEKLLQKLDKGVIDFILLTSESAKSAGRNLESVVLPISGEQTAQVAGLSVYSLEKEEEIYVFWNPSVLSKSRDRMAALLCREAQFPHKMCG